ncbi:MAG: reverse transcriptase [Deltaproteobacteria bacterium]|nr:reverse transcriptase [Deltaproteobacteria bacterium]
MQRLHEHLARLGVEVNTEKTKIVDLLGGEAFEVLGVERRRVPNRARDGYFILLTPRKRARLAIKARLRELLRRGGATPLKELIAQLNAVLAGWVQYFRVGNASRAFSEIRDYVELKVRTLLTRRKRRHKRSVGWRRWSNEYLYDVLGLFWDWKLRPLQGAGAYQ